MTLPDALVSRLEKCVTLYGRGEAVPAAEVEERLRAHGILVDADYVDLVRRWGGCFVGVPVHAGGNASALGRETCVELTLRARRDGVELGRGLVFADDGAGNPIWIAESGDVLTADHNAGGQMRELAPSFRALLEESVHEV